MNLLTVDSEVCNYYCVEEYINLLVNNSQNYNFQLLNFNIRSFHSNGDTFSVLLNSLKTLPKVIVLTETWNYENNYEMCSLENYQGYHSYRNVNRGGGVSIFCLNEFHCEKLLSLTLCNETIESCAVRISFSKYYIIILAIYRPHSDTINNFTEILTEILQNPLITNAYMVILAGDMNINLNDLDSVHVNNYTSCLSSSFFIPAITKCTRFPSNDINASPSNLDHIWFNKLFNFESGMINIDISDHLPTFLHLFLNHDEVIHTKTKIEFRPITQRSLDKFVHELACVDWGLIFDHCDAGVATEKFIKKLNYIYCKHFPLKIKYLSQKRLNNPWLTPRIKNMIKEKSNQYKLFRMGIISCEGNRRFRNKVNQEVKRAKNEYYINSFIRYKNDVRKSWTLIRSLMGGKRKCSSVKELVINGVTHTSPSDICESFNEFFTSIAENLENSLPVTDICPLSYITPQPNSFFLSPVSENEILYIISQLKITKTDVNHVPVKVIKIISSSIVKPLCHLINASFNTGIFPDCLKLARITQIYKSGNHNNPSNYRPIASISYFSKIFEKCLCKQLVSYFDKFSLFSNSQFGFRKSKSTCDALLELTECIYNSLNNRKYHINVLIDLRKAFDVVSHSVLTMKLERYGVRGIPLKLLNSFLSNRQQYVKMGPHSSSLRDNCIGVPQGSNLGPILFLIYVNDFPRVSSALHTILFADDTSFSISNTDYATAVSTLNVEMESVRSWTLANRLTINVDKTNLILFSNKLPENISPITVCNENVSFVHQCTYLGIKLDNKLKFLNHIMYVTGKLAKSTGILYKIKDNLSTSAKINFYYSFIYPYLSYNVIIWGGTYPTHLENLIIQQKRIIRVLANIPFNGHTSAAFHKFEILKFDDIYKFHVAIYMYKNHALPKFSVQHDINTRNRNLKVPSFNRLTLCQHSISYSGPTIWNSLPVYLKQLDSFTSFKKQLKRHLVSLYA